MPLTIEALLQRLVLEGGNRILLIDESRALWAGDPQAAAHAVETAPTSIAVVPLTGSLYPRNLADFASRIDSAANNADVGHIVVPVDSPGGTYTGTPEAATAVARAQAIKPVTAHVGGLAASAAYWIASQAGAIVMNPSSDAGSIGVLAVHIEGSQALEQMGVRATILRSTPYKAEANMFEPLTAEARDHLQGEIDDAHQEFVRTVAAGRRVSQAKVSADFGKGRTMGARQAVAAGMADRVGSLSDVLGAARTRMGAMRRRSARVF